MKKNKQQIGLYFGSFNPVHNGHLCIAEYMQTHYPFDEIWFVLSPWNPLKEENEILPELQRLKMLEEALAPFDYMNVSTVELKMPKPSYTYLTLRKLKEKHSEINFSIIMGNDAMLAIDKWKNYQEILDENIIYLYPRNDIELLIISKNSIQTTAPNINISASDIRGKIKMGMSLKGLVPDVVSDIIQKEKYYL